MSGHGNRDISGLIFNLGIDAYQYSTTTSSPVRVEDSGFIYYFGSGSRITLPNKFGTILNMKAIGSTLQEPINLDRWKFIPNPNDNCGPTIIKNVYDTILFYKNSFFTGGSIPDQSYLVGSKYENELLTQYQVKYNLAYRHPSYHLLGFLGAKMPMPQHSSVLLTETLRRIKSRVSFFPVELEIDYIQQAWVTRVQSSEYGIRDFLIINTMDGIFCTCPINSPINEEQVISLDYIQSVTPNYPNWVCPFVNVKDTVNSTGQPPLNPIISWSVNSSGTRAIGCLVERTEISNPLCNLVLYGDGSYPNSPSEEVEIGQAKVFAKKAFFGEGPSEPLMIDRLGLVELSFSITLTGRLLTDYVFSVDVINQQAPQNTDSIRVGIAYAKPVLDSVLQTDSIIELFMEFYVTENQQRFHRALDGLYGSETPQYGRWLIKVNGENYLSFPMQAIVDNDLVPISFSSMKHMVTATTFYTELENLDLGTLSFYRTVRARQPTLTRNVPKISSGSWLGYMNHLTKLCAIQTDVFVNGQIVETKTCGSETILPLILTYLSNDFNIEQQTSLIKWSATLTYPLRANYRSFITKPLTGSSFQAQGRIGPQWWANILFWPMWYILIEMYHKQVAGSFVKGPYHDFTYQQLLDLGLTVDDRHTDCNHGCNSTYISLSELTSENFITEFWEKLLAFDDSQTDIVSIYSLLSIARGGYVRASVSWQVMDLLAAANPAWDLEITDIQWLVKQIVFLMKDLFNPIIFTDLDGVYNPINGDTFDSYNYHFTGYEYIVGLCCANYHSSDGQNINSTQAFWMIDPGHTQTFNDHFVIRDYPWVWHFAIQNYNRLLVTDFRNGIMVHPNNHYSIMHDYIYCPTGPQPEGEYFAYTNTPIAELYPDNPLSDYRTAFEHTTPPPISAHNGFMIDKISFWGGAIETTHIETYNTVFKKSETLNQYYPSGGKFYNDWTTTQEPIIVYGGYRYPIHQFNNWYFRFDLSTEANTFLKDNDVSLAYPRIAPLWGKA